MAMPRHWEPPPMWKDEDVYIVGGGPSLATFDWNLIRGKKTIGCNSAFILGADIVKLIIFADYAWWKEIGELKLPAYGGIVVACCPRLEEDRNVPKWVLTMPREENHVGLGRDNRLGFNGNTGCLSIDLALRLGAKRIFLLGFDMKMKDDRPNWHDVRHEPAVPEVYQRFRRSMDFVARDLKARYPGREVINVSNISALRAFPMVSLEEHFGAVAAQGERS